MDKKVDINRITHRKPNALSALIITLLISGFLYSARSLQECILITGGLGFTALGVWLVCQSCLMRSSVCTAAAIIFAFSPFITQLAVLNPFLPLIIGFGIWLLLPWVNSLSNQANLYNISFVMIIFPAVFFAVVFSLLASPTFMDSINLAPFFPMPISEHPVAVLPSLLPPSYADGIPVAASYVMLGFAVIGFFKLPFISVLLCILCAVVSLAGFEKAIFQIPPAIWAVFPILAISMLSANGLANSAYLLKKHINFRPIWVFILALIEIIVIAYYLTY